MFFEVKCCKPAAEELLMEEKLKILFDYQRFDNNKKIGELIRETEMRHARELSDDDLTMVAAAGELPETVIRPYDGSDPS